jgi:hypothetical protein
MKKSYLFFCLMIFFLSTGFRAGDEPLRTISSPGSKLLSDWISLHLNLVRNTKGLSQGQLFRHFTYTSISLYESVVPGDKNYTSLSGQLQGLDSSPVPVFEKTTCWQASANTSMAAMLRTFYNSVPSNVQKIDSLERYYASVFLKEGFTSENIRTASEYGATVAGKVLEWAKNDGSSKTHPSYEVPKGDGLWEPTPPGFSAPAAPYAFHNRTCVKNSTANTLPPPPAKFSTEVNSPFYAMVNEVYTTSQNLSDEQRATALFWDDFPDGRYYGAAGHWASIFRQVVLLKQLSLVEASEAYAAMNMAMMDAFNACWKAKYTYNVLRPVTYVQKYIGHPEWKPLITTPAHPEYPAAHASMSMAAATALTNVLGNNIAFTDHSYDDLGFAPRSFKNFNEAGKEAGLSRLYGGIHYRPSIEAGYALGSKTATNVLNGIHFKKKKQI